ncbi:MAG TPA: alpha-L-arabinofuranosidase C-terminal domain-containing protein [Candidatus Acidoferrales bacterium]|nr:alpha-L-arabinofuranosidase C-terminal domain-containing protein [Candidatus Acidoferrales bacterium]
MKRSNSGRREFLKTSLAAALGAAAFPLVGSAADVLDPQRAQFQPAPIPATVSPARIQIDFDRPIGRIDRNIYGNFIEHLGRCIYGGIYDPGSPLADEDGFRKDVLQAVRDLHVSVLRWPGGNFASGYNWKDGIGPKEQRPRRWDTAWQEVETNQFGTDDFIKYCRKINAEPYITINMGTGTMQEAADWVEYCNATTDTSWANLRKKYGHPEPYNVKLWGVGNEMYGSWQAGHKDATDYAKDALEFAKMMRWIDPSIKLVACGGNNVDWDFPVLEHLVNEVDYISLHHYGGSLDQTREMLDETNFTRQVRALDGVINAVMSTTRKRERVAIAADEWNVWFRAFAGRGTPNKLEEIYNLRDALWVGSAMNMFHRQCNTIKLANLAQLCNVIAPMMTSPTALVLQTTYFPLKLYAQYSGNVALDPLIKSDTFPNLPDTPYLDVSVTTDDTHSKLVIAAVNRHPTADIEAEIVINGFKPQGTGTWYEVNGPSLDATNTFASPNNVGVKQHSFSGAGPSFRETFPAHSVNVLTMPA